MHLKDKKVFITAAGQGIGRAIAERFILEGALVTATDINVDTLNTLEGSNNQILDVTDKKSLEDLINDIAPDVLVNCAGIVHNGTILESTDDELSFAMDLNVRPMINAIKVVIPIMEKKKSGSIINIASVASSVLGVANRFVYSTTKAAVIGLTKSVAKDFVNTGIRCNCICPGTVDTPSLHQRLKDTGDYESALKDFIARQPMGRIAQPEEIASLALYLASDESKFTTGHAHIIDGGMVNG
ncbi:MAG: SDR family oxidoreductase [Dehalococcoidia bacterium]|jgi:2-keto-3-deoxy-L-fuconate dehydrogenase